MGDPQWSSLFLKDYTPWKGPTLGHFLQPMGRTHIGQVHGELSPTRGTFMMEQEQSVRSPPSEEE